jgi:type I restriction enzyme S subunit
MNNNNLIAYIEVLNSKKTSKALKLSEKVKKQEWFFTFKNMIPEHWVDVNFMDITWLITCGVAKKPHYVDEGIPFLSAQNARPFKTNLNKIKYISQETYDKITVGGKPEKNDILYTRVGNCGEAASIPYEFDFGIYVSLTLIKPIHELVDHKFLVAFLNSKYGKIQANVGAIGIGLKNLNVDNVRKYRIPLPPLAEQQRIVAKIEELFSSLDKGIETLKTAKAQLKVYRQAVLKYAFEGRLTNTNLKEGELPKGWVEKKFIDVSTKIGDIDHKMPAKVDDGIYPYLSTGDITVNHKLDFNSSKKISRDDYIRLSRKIKPERGDIIFPRYGTIGRNVLVETDVEFLISYACAIIKPDHKQIKSIYLYHYTLSSLIQKEIKKHTVETTQANVGIASIKDFNIILPTELDEQENIVQEIESRLSVCDKIEESIEQSLQQAEALRQSILKKAFEGKLVPQNPKDEPASVLLERIKTEREKSKPQKVVKEKKAKTKKGKV